MRLERRSQISWATLVLAPVGAVLATLLVSAALVLWAGAPVGRTYAAIFEGGFGSVFALSETLTRSRRAASVNTEASTSRAALFTSSRVKGLPRPVP